MKPQLKSLTDGCTARVTRGARVAVDGGNVFSVMGGPINSFGQASSTSFRKALFDAVVR